MPSIDIYTKYMCPYCVRAKALLDRKGTRYREIDVTSDRAAFAEMQARAPGRRTVPQIFIGDRHIGGSDDLHALDARGGLDGLLSQVAT